MCSWGAELWDRYSSVVGHVVAGGEELTSVLAKLIREKGDIEKEYAKNMRKLVSKYKQKMVDKKTSQAQGIR